MLQTWRERMTQPSVPTLVAAGTPPAVVSGAPLMDVTVADWVQFAMLGYTAILIVVALPKLIDAMKDLHRRWRDWRAGV